MAGAKLILTERFLSADERQRKRNIEACIESYRRQKTIDKAKEKTSSAEMPRTKEG